MVDDAVAGGALAEKSTYLAVDAAVFMSVARMRANTGAVWFGSAGSTVRFVFCPAGQRCPAGRVRR